LESHANLRDLNAGAATSNDKIMRQNSVVPSLLQGRNKTPQPRKTWATLMPVKWVGQRDWLSKTGSIETQMALKRNLSAISAMVLASATLVTAAVEPSMAEETLTRTELCGKLQQQVQHAITEHAEAKRAAKAKALQKTGTRFCASNKQAQGIRSYAQALKLLGVQPVD
jgi:hypothetical protein